MEAGSNAGDKDETGDGFAVDTRKTYEQLLNRKEKGLAKEAQFERRAMALTKHFMKANTDMESHKMDGLKDASQRSYDSSMAKVKHGYDSEVMLREMVREEKNQIAQLMSERARQRELDEEKRQKEKADREYYMQARVLHSQLQAEERHKAIETLEKQRAEAIKERMKAHDDRQKELSNASTEGSVASTALKFNAELEKVLERKRILNRKTIKEQHEKLAAKAEREKKALGASQEAKEQRKQDIREAEEDRQRKVQERKKLDDQDIVDKVQKLADKGFSPTGRPHMPHTARSAEPSSHQARTAGETKARASEAGDGEAKENVDSPKTEERKVRSHGAAMPGFNSKELVDLNNDAAKDYVLRYKELDDAKLKMQNSKKYKVLSEGATGQPDDYRTSRLRAVHQTYMATKPKQKEPDTPISVRGDKRPVARTSPRTLRCGLCEKEFAPEHLVGSALRRTIERMRHQSPNLPKTPSQAPSPRKSQFYSEGGYEDGHTGEEHTSVAHKPATKKQSLYDYEVKLCVNCDIFVRIAST